MSRRERLLLAAIVITAVIDMAIPYGLLKEAGRYPFALAIFWITLTAAVTVLGFFYTGNWKDTPEKGSGNP